MYGGIGGSRPTAQWELVDEGGNPAHQVYILGRVAEPPERFQTFAGPAEQGVVAGAAQDQHSVLGHRGDGGAQDGTDRVAAEFGPKRIEQPHDFVRSGFGREEALAHQGEPGIAAAAARARG